ncbi:hemagglutinin repeat-containing protein, partial [Pantoea piersonii]|uniref:hemagglutinin repeat-containing protein n=1 Tax=Pantoea piersonii TaxID=2364647 RepID=UPI002FDB242C
SEQRTAQGSSLTAGDNLSVMARGSGVQGADGDLMVQGSQLQAGKDVLLSANRDLSLLSAENTSSLEGKNESHGGTLGVGVGVGQGGWGFNISASVNKSRGSEQGSGVTHTETQVSAGNQVMMVSGRDTLLQGAQVSGERVKADVGRNLTLASEQDSDRYDSKQQSVSAGGSFNIGSMTGSASLSASRDKMHSNWQSVEEQTGIFAGKGGFDVTVGEHTQLDGAVIGSTADASLNKLETGTLGFSDIENRADYKVEHQSAGISTGGSIGSQFAGNMANGLLVGANHSGSDSSTTKAAEAEWRAAHPDKEPKAGDISGQVYQTFYNEAFNASGLGTGSAIQQGIQAATAAIQGLAGGNIGQAVSGAAAPYLAEVIHDMTTTKDANGNDVVNVQANLMAHAVVGAVTAYAAGNSAVAGASGAAMGEYIAQQMYPGVKREDLTEEQRQTISTLGTLAAGLAGGVTGDSTAGAVAGAQAGKNAVENNSLSDLTDALAAGKTSQQVAKERVEEENERYKKENCAGMSAEACSVKMYNQRREELKDILSRVRILCL